MAALVGSACVADQPDAYTISFTGDVQTDTELGTYKTGADGFTVLSISGGRDVAINGIHVATPYIAVVNRDAQIVQLASVAGVDARSIATSAWVPIPA